MKNVLVTGAAGMIGMEVIRELLNDGSFSITAVDLRNLKSKINFDKYKDKINVIYGDLTNREFVEKIIVDMDYVIHLATILPPTNSFNESLAELTELTVTDNFARSISYFNKDCKFIFASTTSLYKYTGDLCDSNSKVVSKFSNFYDKYKFKSENLVKNKISNYTIVRIPLVLGKIKGDPFFYSVNKDDVISTISKEDAALCFKNILLSKNKFNSKIINISSNDSFIMTYKDLISSLVSNNALNSKMIFSLLFLDKVHHFPVCLDIEDSNKLLNYQQDNFSNYLARVKYNNRGRFFSKYIKGIFLKLWQRKK